MLPCVGAGTCGSVRHSFFFRSPALLAMLAAALSVVALLQASAAGPADADTRAWWQRAAVLSADSMEGRDAGSRGYERAARHVARWLAAAGVKPLGDGGSWYQWVPMEEVAVTAGVSTSAVGLSGSCTTSPSARRQCRRRWRERSPTAATAAPTRSATCAESW